MSSDRCNVVIVVEPSAQLNKTQRQHRKMTNNNLEWWKIFLKKNKRKKLSYDYYYSYALCDVSFQIIIP